MHADHRLIAVASVWTAVTMVAAGVARPEEAERLQPTRQDVASLLPGAAQLPGFGEVAATGKGAPHAGAIQPGLEALNLETTPAARRPGGVMSRIDRVLRPEEGPALLELSVRLWDRGEAAAADLLFFRLQSSARDAPGTFAGPTPIGDESWVLAAGPANNSLSWRAGNLFGRVVGSCRSGQPAGEFPPAVVQAMAHAVLLRASRIPAVTEVAG